MIFDFYLIISRILLLLVFVLLLLFKLTHYLVMKMSGGFKGCEGGDISLLVRPPSEAFISMNLDEIYK